MHAILLAAGVGSRISPHISSQHKCLLPIPTPDHIAPYVKNPSEELSLLEYTIISVQHMGITHISVVTGYLHQDIEKTLTHYNVSCVYNPFYYLVNSIGSLWMAREALVSQDLLILNADTFLAQSIYTSLAREPLPSENPLLLIDSTRKAHADVKVRYAQNILQDYGKTITQPSMAESTDVFLIPKKIVPHMKAQLDVMLEEKHHDTWWESVLVDYRAHIPIHIKDIAPHFWQEIDYYEDYQKIRAFLSTKKK